MKFPSKTFLLGEYAVLGGGPALVLAHEPCFSSEMLNAPQAQSPYPAGSPAFKLAHALSIDPARFTFSDPHNGRGGFGASGAEFLSVARHHPQAPAEPDKFAWFARELYLGLGEQNGSGVDLLAQAGGKTGMLLVRLQEKQLSWLAGNLGAELTLFHTGRKLPTHEHLRSTPKTSALDLVPEVEAALAALRNGELDRFALALSKFAKGLSARGLLASHSAQALEGLKSVTGVLAAKGCGAMGSDVLLVLSKSRLPGIADWASEHSLVEVARVAI